MGIVESDEEKHSAKEACPCSEDIRWRQRRIMLNLHVLAEGGLLGEDEFLELTAPRPQPSAAALKAAALRASNSAFAGDNLKGVHAQSCPKSAPQHG